MSSVLSMLQRAALLDFGIQGAGFVVAAALKTESFYDCLGAVAGLAVAYKSLQWGPAKFPRQFIQSGCFAVWATRLGLFLVSRMAQDGKDRRFNGVRDNPPKFALFWFLQGVWVLSNLLPTLVQNSKETDTPITWKEYTGWGMWALGFLIQVIADRQKSAFRADPANARRFISTGLWGLSRHPNYFGEMMMWTGLYLSASPTLRGWEHFSVISPLFSALLLTQVSGPDLERRALKKWGDTPEYLKYLSQTPCYIPDLKNLFR